MLAATSGRAGIPVNGNASHRRAWAANHAWTTSAIPPHASVSTAAIAPASLTVSDSDGDLGATRAGRSLAGDAGRAGAGRSGRHGRGSRLDPVAGHRLSAPRIAWTGTCASSAHASIPPLSRRVRWGTRTSRACRSAASRLSCRSGARVWRTSLRATISSLAAVRGAASRTRRPRSTPLRGRVQHPGDVRRVRGDDLVGLAGEGAAVDHGETVGLARVGDELAERVVVAAR